MATKKTTAARSSSSSQAMDHQAPVQHKGGGIYVDDDGNEYGPEEVEFNGNGWQVASEATLKARGNSNEHIPSAYREPRKNDD